jgi:hypothetical protein
MTSILIISKYGIIKPLMVKHYDEATLYKKAGFKSPVNFDCQTIWNISMEENKKYSIFLYAKKSGKAGQENHYEFPSPVDSTLFFGNCVLVSKDKNNTALSLTTSEWEEIYNSLNGGFHELKETHGDESDQEEDQEEEDQDDENGEKTKNGYLKDGFVVEDENEEDQHIKRSIKIKQKPTNELSLENKSKNKNAIVKKKKNINNTPVNENIYLNCKTELTFEEYV